MTDNKADVKNEKPNEKPEEIVPKPKKIQKPLNPLAAKPGQNYGSPKFQK